MRLAASAGRIGQVVKKELLELRRDPRLWRLLLLAPAVQLVVFGYAVTTDYRHTATFVVDHDGSRTSRELLDALTASGYFDVVARLEREAELVDALDRGRAMMGVVLPVDFGGDLASGRSPSVQLLFDGTHSNLATVARGYAESIITGFGARLAGAPGAPVELRERAWFNPELASRSYNVPAVMGAILLLVCLLMTSLAVVREREIGTLEQLMVSPLKPLELIVGKTLPFALLGLVDLVVIFAVAIGWFQVPFRGSFALLVGASLLYLLSGLGLGLVISTLSNTQQEAFLTSFLVFMPSILLSGFMFPVTSMPAVFRWITLLNPMRHYLEVVRAVFLKGAGTAALAPQLLTLAAMGVGILALAAGRFRKRIG